MTIGWSKTLPLLVRGAEAGRRGGHPNRAAPWCHDSYDQLASAGRGRLHGLAA